MIDEQVYKDRVAGRLKRDGDDCLVYAGARDKDGYGVIQYRRKPRRTHRLVWSWANEADIPAGMVVMHKCDNPPCCNPEHLRLGTVADNNADRSAKGRTTRSGPNVPHHPNGELHPMHRLSEDEVRQIRRWVREGWTQASVADYFNISRASVSLIVNRKPWGHVPDEAPKGLKPDQLADFTERLRSAVIKLDDMARTAGPSAERMRLAAKAEGVALALDYLRGY